MSSPESSVAEAHSPPRFRFDNSYARLPERFYARVDPRPVAAPRLIQINRGLAANLGLDAAAMATQEGIEVLAGNRIAEGSEPLAEAYAGHQFGHFVPQLGDGRANLLGEVVGRDGVRYDVQLKGSGPTPFSRRGDGRAALGPVLREYLVSEAMAGLGVPTTRALAAVSSGQSVVRETLQPGAVLTRVAASHIRVGTFQYFAARGDADGVRVLADYVLERHYPEAAAAGLRYRALLDGVVARQARLVAQWMLLGFVHGVMNTDNMAVSGETIDYGPCAFLEAYKANQVFSSIDQQGRYSYSNQPNAAHWNLARLAECLLPLLQAEAGSEQAGLDSAYAALAGFGPQFEAAHLAGLRGKLGLGGERAEDGALAQDLLDRMEANQADFTLTFHLLAEAVEDGSGAGGSGMAVRGLFREPAAFDAWEARWRQRLSEEPAPAAERAVGMRRANPAFIPRNHLVQNVIDAAMERQDFRPFEELLAVVTHPHDDHPGLERYRQPARPEEAVTATFCGT